MRYSLKGNLISALIGIIIGLPLSIYAVNHRTPTDWTQRPVSEPIPIKLDLPVECEELKHPDFPEKVMETETLKPIDFVYVEFINLSEEDQLTVFNICQEYDISYTLVLSLIEHECGEDCDTKQISASNDWGAMQINQCNHEWLESEFGVIDFLDLEDNVNAGCFILKTLFDKYDGNDSQVLMAYNMGERGASALWEKGITSSKYSEAILEREYEVSKYIDERKMTP